MQVTGTVTDYGPPFTDGVSKVGQWNFTQMFQPHDITANTPTGTVYVDHEEQWGLDHIFPYMGPFPEPLPQGSQFRDSPALNFYSDYTSVTYDALLRLYFLGLSTFVWTEVKFS